MKKFIGIAFAALIGIFILFSLFDWRGNYRAEQIIWRANKKLSKVINTPETTPDKTFEDITNEFRKAIKDFPNYPQRARVQIQMGGVYMAKKDFAKARQVFEQVFKDYPTNDIFKSEALVAIGKTYEQEGSWLKAETTYRKVISDYPLTENGLTMPLYLGNVYKQRGAREKAVNAYKDAAVYYGKMAEQNRGKPIEFRAMQLLADSYLALEDWNKGVESLGNLLLAFPGSPAIGQTVQAINIVAVIQLKDYDKAQAIHESFMKKYPRHPLNKILKQVIAGFKTLKEKNVVINPKATPK